MARDTTSLQSGGITLTAAEVADLLRVNRETVYLLASKGQIPHARVGRRLRFSQHAIVRWLEGRATSEEKRCQ